MTIIAVMAWDVRLRVSVSARQTSNAGHAVLETVEAGIHRPDKVRGFLGLSRETFAEIVVDLLRKDLLWLNFSTGALALAPRESNIRDRTAALNTSSRDARTVTLCYLPQLDILMPRQPLWKQRYPSSWKGLPMRDVRRWTELTPAELLAGASLCLPTNLAVGEVLDFAAEPGVLRVEVVRYAAAGREERVAVQPIGSGRWRRPHVAALELAISEVRQTAPQMWSQFDKADAPGPERADDERTIHAFGFQDLVSILRSATPTTRQKLDALIRELKGLGWSEECRVFGGAAAVREAVSELLHRATESAVVASAFISLHGVEWVETVIKDCAPGVRIGVGAGMNRKLADEETQLLRRLSGAGARYPIAITADDTRGNASHAKFAIADDNLVVVTSHNVLSGSDDTFEIGLSLAGGDAALRLSAAFSACLPAEVGALLGQRRGLLQSRLGAFDASLATVAEDSDKYSAAVNEAVELLEHCMAADIPCVQPIGTLEHRLLLLQMLERSNRFLLVASHRISNLAVDDRLVAALVSCLKRKVRVMFLWGDLGPGGSEAVSCLTSVKDHGLFLAQVPGWHAKVIACDNISVAVGSYEYLNLVAYVRRDVSEVSVLVTSRATCEATIRLVANHLDGAFAKEAAELREWLATLSRDHDSILTRIASALEGEPCVRPLPIARRQARSNRAGGRRRLRKRISVDRQ